MLIYCICTQYLVGAPFLLVEHLFLPHFFHPLNLLLTCLSTALCEQPASLALHLFNTQVSQCELNYWNKWTFPRHSNLLRCICMCMLAAKQIRDWNSLFVKVICGDLYYVKAHFFLSHLNVQWKLPTTINAKYESTHLTSKFSLDFGGNISKTKNAIYIYISSDTTGLQLGNYLWASYTKQSKTIWGNLSKLHPICQYQSKYMISLPCTSFHSIFSQFFSCIYKYNTYYPANK